MVRCLRLLGAYMRLAILKWLGWRSFALTLVINQAVLPLIGLAVWTAAVPDRAATLGCYYLSLLVVQMLVVSYENHTFSGRIYEGELADDLLLPLPPVLNPLGENLAIRVWHLILGAPLIIGAALLVRSLPTPANVAAALPALILAAAIRFLYTYSLAMTAFWTERAHGVVSLGATLVFLLGGEAAPLALMPAPLRAVVSLLPFRSMHGFPAEIAAGLVSGRALLTGYLAQCVWLVSAAMVALLVWRSGIRRYMAVGG